MDSEGRGGLAYPLIFLYLWILEGTTANSLAVLCVLSFGSLLTFFYNITPFLWVFVIVFEFFFFT
jgi:hypothetical protein